jgi:Rrf2 family protein
MESILRISEAASIGLHAAALLAASERPLSVAAIARRLGCSSAHLSKVLQTLSKRGLVQAKRGPSGGYTLSQPAAAVRLLAIYEAIEGPLPTSTCLLQETACDGRCLLGGLVAELNRTVARAFEGATLAEFAERAQRIGLALE